MPPHGPILEPWDEHNQQLAANVHPSGWQNPRPSGRYNLVVIGAGTAGLVTAAGAAALGAKVALVEKHLMGGDCLNVGCVPSKALLRAARAAHEARRAGQFGVRVSQVEVDFPAVMERVRSIRASLSPHDSAQRFTELGVDVFFGEGRFVNGNTVEVDGEQLSFKQAVIATGARAAVPDLPGLREAGFFTNETIFNLTTLPQRLAVIGGGPIGCELAQAFQRLGASVTLFHNKAHLLDREDEDAARVVQEQFAREGIQLQLGAKLSRVEVVAGEKVVHFEMPDRAETASAPHHELSLTQLRSAAFDAILLAVGRQPNVNGLNLEAVGVNYDAKQGVHVSDTLRTSHRRIFACGDVCMDWKFTHAADFAARTVIQNALFLGRKRLSVLAMPWSTYTDPELAHVGLSERESAHRGVKLDTYIQPFAKIDRAVTEGATEGFVKIHTRSGTDAIVGATIVGPHAGDLVSEIAVAMSSGCGLSRLASVIHPYPTFAEALRKCGDAYNRTRLTPRLRSAFGTWLKWTR